MFDITDYEEVGSYAQLIVISQHQKEKTAYFGDFVYTFMPNPCALFNLVS